MQPQTLPAPLPVSASATGAQEVPLFPPRDADADTYRAWLARADWPEVVFGAQIPATRA